MAKVSMTLDPNATDDQTGAEMVTLLEALTGAGKLSADATKDGSTNLTYTTTLNTKLGGIEASATADQTGAEIKTAYSAETGAYTDTKDTKLTGIEAGATGDQTGAEVQTAVLGLADADRKLIKSDPAVGEHWILNIQRDATGKLDVDYESVARVS